MARKTTKNEQRLQDILDALRPPVTSFGEQARQSAEDLLIQARPDLIARMATSSIPIKQLPMDIARNLSLSNQKAKLRPELTPAYSNRAFAGLETAPTTMTKVAGIPQPIAIAPTQSTTAIGRQAIKPSPHVRLNVQGGQPLASTGQARADIAAQLEREQQSIPQSLVTILNDLLLQAGLGGGARAGLQRNILTGPSSLGSNITLQRPATRVGAEGVPLSAEPNLLSQTILGQLPIIGPTIKFGEEAVPQTLAELGRQIKAQARGRKPTIEARQIKAVDDMLKNLSPEEYAGTVISLDGVRYRVNADKTFTPVD